MNSPRSFYLIPYIEIKIELINKKLLFKSRKKKLKIYTCEKDKKDKKDNTNRCDSHKMHKVYDINPDEKIESDDEAITFILNKGGKLKIKGIENINTREIDYTKFRFKDFSLKNQNGNKYSFTKNGKLINNKNKPIPNINPIRVKHRELEDIYTLNFNENKMKKEGTNKFSYISIKNKKYKSIEYNDKPKDYLVQRINKFIELQLPETEKLVNLDQLVEGYFFVQF